MSNHTSTIIGTAQLVENTIFSRSAHSFNLFGTTLQFRQNISSDKLNNSTSTDEINARNLKFSHELHKREKRFVSLLLHSYFEDGLSNDAIEWIDNVAKENEYATALWLHSLFSLHQKDKQIIYRLLRILAFVKLPNTWRTFIVTVRGFLNDKDVEVQEAALMVFEEYRTIECANAIEETVFTSPWMKKYAEELALDIKQEQITNVC